MCNEDLLRRLRSAVPPKIEVEVYAVREMPAQPQLRTVFLEETALVIRGKVRLPGGEGCGIVRDGQVVAWAVVRPPDAQGLRQITVECDRAYRRRGFATACICAAVRRCSGEIVYLCQSSNRASAAVAKAAGLNYVGTIRKEG